MAGNQKAPKVVDLVDTPAVIAPNNFKFKSLSNWSYNISTGCLHGCSFCYVPSTTTIKREIDLEEKAPIPELWKEERISGKHWSDHHWGEYSLLRRWDEDEFRRSLHSAEKATKIAPDSNRAVMFCTTTDPYQTFSVPGNPAKTKLLNAARAALVRNALQMILEESTLNVRILTRSPMAKEDFELYKQFGNRLMFGMSLPTLDDKLSQIYEPGAPGPIAKLKTLQAAKEAGLHLYVAVAPTLPDEGHTELKSLLKTVAQLEPLTIFHEPINLRAENVARIQSKARELGRSIRGEVFETRSRWREYAFGQLSLMEKIAKELKIPDGVLHLWPDADLASQQGFLKMKANAYERESHSPTLPAGKLSEARKQWRSNVEPWIQYWHNPSERVSAWPGKRVPKWK